MFGSGALRSWLGLEGGALMTGISALKKETPDKPIPSFCHTRIQVCCLWPDSHQNPATPISEVQPPELGGAHLLFIKHSLHGIVF